jgi:hypothetical protein
MTQTFTFVGVGCDYGIVSIAAAAHRPYSTFNNNIEAKVIS